MECKKETFVKRADMVLCVAWVGMGWDGMMMIEKYGGWVRRGRPAFV